MESRRGGRGVSAAAPTVLDGDCESTANEWQKSRKGAAICEAASAVNAGCDAVSVQTPPRALELPAPLAGLRVRRARLHDSRMGDAAKVIDWNGTDLPAELTDVPPGRYMLVAVDDEDFVVTPEDELAIARGRADVAAGRVFTLAEVDARLRATIEAASARTRSG